MSANIKEEQLSHASVVEGGAELIELFTDSLRKNSEEKVNVIPFNYLHFNIEDSRNFRRITSGTVSSKTIYIVYFGSYTADVFEVLLKNIEEPADNVKFIFIFNSIGSVPPTFLSRCSLLSNEINGPDVTTEVGAADFLQQSVVARLKLVGILIEKHDDDGGLKQASFNLLRNIEIFLSENKDELIDRKLILERVYFTKQALSNSSIPTRLVMEQFALALP